MVLSRLVPYWVTVGAVGWTLIYAFLRNAANATQRFEDNVIKFFSGFTNDPEVLEYAPKLLGFIVPIIMASCVCALLLTNHPLPSWRNSWINKAGSALRRFRLEDAEYGAALAKQNQFGVGEPNFNIIAFALIAFPLIIQFLTNLKYTLESIDDTSNVQGRMESFSKRTGLLAAYALSFFLIPVARHSILLVALNWSPIHALRIHVWSGYSAILLVFIHGLLYVIVWFKFANGPITDEIFPRSECWNGAFPPGSKCKSQLHNMTGLIASFFYFMLWSFSINWFRRRYYRIFYLVHVTCGTMALLASFWHFKVVAVYCLPSICYYLALTMPTLVQAFASRLRGGVKIVKVVCLKDAADIVEVHFETHPTTQAALVDNHPSKYAKFCVPDISIVWHPFTVFSHPKDTSTVRILFRPTGPFTNELSARLISSERPLVLIDGFYRGGDRTEQALQHDHITLISGGIGITPFISMMNTILKVVSERNSKTSKLKSMTLVWSCREYGLMSHVKKSYFHDMAIAASQITDFTLKIRIFCTSKNNHTLENEHDSERDSEVNSIQSPGHAMELGRMMAGRYVYSYLNLPYFIAFAGSVWLGFHIIFSTINQVPTAKDMSKTTWIMILTIVFFLAIGIVIEFLCHYCGDYWSSSATNPNDTSPSNENNTNDITPETYPVDVVSSTIVIEQGRRPDPSDLFAEVRSAECPGIFMCGPPALINMVKAEEEISVDNSPLLSRYALYEEGFEM